MRVENDGRVYELSVFSDFDATGDLHGQTIEMRCDVGCGRIKRYFNDDIDYFHGMYRVPRTDRIYLTSASGAYLIIAVYGIINGEVRKIFQHASKTEPVWTMDDDGNDSIIISEAEFIDRERFLRERRFKWSAPAATYVLVK